LLRRISSRPSTTQWEGHPSTLIPVGLGPLEFGRASSTVGAVHSINPPRGVGDAYKLSPEAKVLQLSRRALPFLLALPLLALAAPAQALPPAVTLTSPVGHQAANPPSFAGTAGTKEWESGEIAVEVYAGEGVAGKPIVVANAVLNRETGAFGGTLAAALADGTYTARASQRNTERETGYSAPLVFTIGAPPVEPTATPEATPAPVAAVATPTPAPVVVAPAVKPPTPYVCASRRDFTKHVLRPAGTKLRVAATVNGRALKSKIGSKEIRIRIDLRGEPKDTYTLRVAITRTRPDGTRITTVAVEQIDYHTCIPTAKPSY
jgi:hypothetical protein